MYYGLQEQVKRLGPDVGSCPLSSSWNTRRDFPELNRVTFYLEIKVFIFNRHYFYEKKITVS